MKTAQFPGWRGTKQQDRLKMINGIPAAATGRSKTFFTRTTMISSFNAAWQGNKSASVQKLLPGNKKRRRQSLRLKTKGVVVYYGPELPVIAVLKDISDGGFSFYGTEDFLDANHNFGLNFDILVFNSQNDSSCFISSIKGVCISTTQDLSENSAHYIIYHVGFSNLTSQQHEILKKLNQYGSLVDIENIQST